MYMYVLVCVCVPCSPDSDPSLKRGEVSGAAREEGPCQYVLCSVAIVSCLVYCVAIGRCHEVLPE